MFYIDILPDPSDERQLLEMLRQASTHDYIQVPGTYRVAPTIVDVAIGGITPAKPIIGKKYDLYSKEGFKVEQPVVWRSDVTFGLEGTSLRFEVIGDQISPCCPEVPRERVYEVMRLLFF